MSHTLMLRCGRCGDSMEWRVDDRKALTELLIVPCRRCLDAVADAVEEQHRQKVLDDYCESMRAARIKDLLKGEDPPLDLLDRTCYGAGAGPVGVARVGAVKDCWKWFREKCGAA